MSWDFLFLLHFQNCNYSFIRVNLNFVAVMKLTCNSSHTDNTRNTKFSRYHRGMGSNAAKLCHNSTCFPHRWHEICACCRSDENTSWNNLMCVLRTEGNFHFTPYRTKACGRSFKYALSPSFPCQLLFYRSSHYYCFTSCKNNPPPIVNKITC